MQIACFADEVSQPPTHLQTELIDVSTMECYLNTIVTIETFRPQEQPANAQDGGGVLFTTLHIQTKVHTDQLAGKDIQ